MTGVRRVALLLFDGVEVLDFAGPFEVFGIAGWTEPRPPFDVYCVAQSGRTVLARNNLRIEPDYDFATCPRPDLLVVPGGFGTRREMHNPRLIGMIGEVAEDAERVLSVCTGALLLGRAGLLDGLEATTHRSALEELRKVAPTARVHDDARIVDNGKVVLSTGISAGIDMSLYVVAQLCGMTLAASAAEYMHYDWRHREPDGRAVISAGGGAVRPDPT